MRAHRTPVLGTACLVALTLVVAGCDTRRKEPSAESLRRSACSAALDHQLDEARQFATRAAKLDNRFVPLVTDLMNKIADRDRRLRDSVTFDAACRDVSSARAAARSKHRGSSSRVLWRRKALGTDGLPSSGRIVESDGRLIFVSSGYSERGERPGYSIAALDRDSGATVWKQRRLAPTFLQAALPDVLIANEQYHLVQGLAPETGQERWSIDLAQSGLRGFGAIQSAVEGTLVALGLSQSSEGGTGPPVVLAIDARTGAERWRTTLAPGTDLTWGSPSILDGVAIFLSTLSHPMSAPGNTAHAVRLSDGALLWDVDLGGTQAFHSRPAAVTPGAIHIPTQTGSMTVDAATGTVLWSSGDGFAAPLTVGDDLWLVHPNRIVVVDPQTGTERHSNALREPIDIVISPTLMADLTRHEGGLVLAYRRTQVLAIRARDREELWHVRLGGRAVEAPIVFSDRIVIADIDRSVTALRR